MDIYINKTNLFKVLFFLSLLPYTIFKISYQITKYFYNKKVFNGYSYDKFKLNKAWFPLSNYKELKNTIVAFTLAYVLYVFIYFKFESLVFVLVTLFYGFLLSLSIRNFILSKVLCKKLVHLKEVYVKVEEKEIFLTNKVNELIQYINIKDLEQDNKSFNYFIFLINLYKVDTNMIDEVIGFKELINNQLDEIKNYYVNQNKYLISTLDLINEEMSVKVKCINESILDKIIINEQFTNQSNNCRELYKTLLQYKAIFNTFVKDNLAIIVEFNQPLSRNLLKYLENVRILTNVLLNLSDDQLFYCLIYNLMNIDINHIKTIIKSRTVLINKRDQEGNTLLHLSVLNNQLELTNFLLGSNIEINVHNNYQLTPLYYARRNKNTVLIRTLVEYHAKDIEDPKFDNKINSTEPNHDLKTKQYQKENVKRIQNKCEEIEVYLINKLKELEYYINLRKIEKEINNINQFINWLDIYQNKTGLINEVYEFKDLINNQFRDIKRYYNNQHAYINYFLMSLNDIKKIYIKIEDELLYNKISNDTQIINQSNLCRELYDDLIRYVAFFNSFIKDNLSNIICLNQPLCQEFLNYLVETRIMESIIKKFSENQLFELLTNNLMKLNINLITSIIISRNDIIHKKNIDGKTLLDLAIINNRSELSNFIQGIDNSTELVSTIAV